MPLLTWSSGVFDGMRSSSVSAPNFSSSHSVFPQANQPEISYLSVDILRLFSFTQYYGSDFARVTLAKTYYSTGGGVVLCRPTSVGWEERNGCNIIDPSLGYRFKCRLMLVVLLFYAYLLGSIVTSWESPRYLPRRQTSSLDSKGIHHREDSGANDGGIWTMETLTFEQFRRRRESFERRITQLRLLRPPNPFLDPKDFVSELLYELRHPRQEHSGFMCLLESSTSQWQKVLNGSVGASESADVANIAASLDSFFRRPNNQFGILVGNEDNDYLLNFPSDPLDYEDGTCWIECRIRSAENDKLLVVTGWSLERRKTDGAWLVSNLDWQDFRENYRPGIGREEWERYVGKAII
eukprot:scaffold3281_cov129-Cylindrotheca_fusiformis.AAC.8